ncbi:hypothetical protein Val02_68320 [Virgisporangium aliadipatigenens]|uniref:AAA+ ATPase domain-containing protein n=1 Tax=Virgisporangium aliadipatigenens TaxID=741659 RepID=A0A8J4DU42_9ACTN|nr:ATP-binding protein [Virgisporangium aliadipatigenens]GIJ49946.1 hypothetical protein Val02_68320 [Virgisporangium aliadipatigenens]
MTVLLDQDGRTWAWTAVEITAAYDLTRRADSIRLDPAQRLAAAVTEQRAYLDRLLSIRPGEVAALRITRVARGSLKMWLLGRVAGPGPVPAVARAAELADRLADVPPQVEVRKVVDQGELQGVLTPFAPAAGGIAQVGKRLRVQGTVRQDAGVASYLAVEPFSREVESWAPLLEVLSGYPHPVSVTVAFTPEQVPPQVRRTLELEATRYARLREPFEMPADTGGKIRFPADSAAGVLEPMFRDALARYADRAFRFSVTVASPVGLDSMIVEAVARSISSANETAARADPTAVPTGYAIVHPRTAEEFEALRNAFASIDPVQLPDHELHQRLGYDRDTGRHGLAILRTLVDRAEAPSLFRLPVAADGRIAGFRVAAPPDDARVVEAVAGPSLLLGRQTGGSEVRFAVADLPRHGFVVGTPGSGKTNTALHLCRQLGAAGVPFLVIEPVNSELDDYRWLATQPGFEDLLVLTVGDESVAPFRLNPFEVPVGATVSAHVSNLLACFEAAFGLWDPLPFIYRRALVRTYRRRGFHPSDRGSQQLAGQWPVLGEFVAMIAEVVGELGYAGEVAHNIDAAATLRAQALAEGACGPTLDCRRSFDIAGLLHRPVIVELAGVGDNAKEQALVTLLLLTAVRGHRRSSRAASAAPHVLLIEEAHRIFPRFVPGAGDPKEGNAAALAAERIAQGLAEDRKYKQSYVLIDQQVGKVAEDAYKITNLKVMHRTAAEEDRQLLGSTMSMHVDQIDAAAALRPFQAVVSHNGLDRAVTVTVPNVRAEDAAARGIAEAPLADDAELRARFLRTLGDSADAMAPYEECHGCAHRCAFRQQAESIMSDRAAARELVGLSPKWPALATKLAELAGPVPGDAPDATTDYRVCVFIHAFRAAYPPHRWSAEGRARAVRWTDRVRRELDPR